MFSDEYFDELQNRLKQYNLTSAINKSRVALGFTNNFQLVSPVMNNNTQINIFKAASKCYGSPCNPNVQLTDPNGQSIILCECLNGSNVNTFVSTFSDLAKQTGVTSGLTSASCSERHNASRRHTNERS